MHATHFPSCRSPQENIGVTVFRSSLEAFDRLLEAEDSPASSLVTSLPTFLQANCAVTSLLQFHPQLPIDPVIAQASIEFEQRR